MKKKLALFFLMCMAGTAFAQDKMADQLRKAIVEEEANQNLDKAIEGYNSILAQYEKQRVTAATALFHLADCYRKQGKNDQAIAAYKRIVHEFPEQNKQADASRNYLTSVFNIQAEEDDENRKRAEIEAAMREAEIEAVYKKEAEIEAAMREAEIEATHKRLELIRQHIEMVKNQIRETEKAVEVGVTDPMELYPLRKELFELQERLSDTEHMLNIYMLQENR